ncbi:MAG TPA: CehA/McbA family metallohydrolase, partial [Polyangiaceae bacterium]
RTDFDAIEVFNGYESAQLDRVEAVLDDWYAFLNAGKRYAATGSSDSHRIQYQWAGYPRTMVRVGATEEEEHKVDPLAIVAAIKAGHATVTSGPIIELELEGVRPGGDVVVTAPRAVVGRLVVRAAPWIDVTSAKIIVGGKTVETFDVPSRPTATGPEPGTLEEAQARTIRLQAEVRVEVGADPIWVVAIARGTRTLDDILPFMPIQPYAVTNPIFIHR